MRRSEGIVHVDVGVDAVHELLDELGLVLGLAGVEAHVLEHHDVSILHSLHGSLHAVADNLVHLRHLLSDQLREASRHLLVKRQERTRTGSSVNLGSGPLGLPRWVTRTTFAPCPVRSYA